MKNRNPIAKIVTRIPPKVVEDKRMRITNEWLKKKIKEELECEFEVEKNEITGT